MPTVRTAEPRNDRDVLRESVGVDDSGSKELEIKDIHAGDQEFKIWSVLFQEYKKTGNPIPADRCAQVVREIAGDIQNPHANLNVMTRKGLLQKVEAPTNCPRIPLSQGIRIWTGTRGNHVLVWPKEVAAETQESEPEISSRSRVIEKVIASPVRFWFEGPWCSDCEISPIRLSQRRAFFYLRLMAAQMSQGFEKPLSSSVVASVMKECGEDTSTVHYFDQRYGLLMRVHSPDHRRGMPVERFVVYTPYQVEGSQEIVIPLECKPGFGLSDSHSADTIPLPAPVQPKESTPLASQFRTKEDLVREVREITQLALERGTQLYQNRLALLQHAYADEVAKVERLKEELERAKDSVQEIAKKLETSQNVGLTSDMKPEEEQRVARLRLLIDNYDLLLK